jgi:hypothetical protein
VVSVKNKWRRLTSTFEIDPWDPEQFLYHFYGEIESNALMHQDTEFAEAPYTMFGDFL